MMHALIDPFGRVAQTSEETFDVAEPLTWVPVSGPIPLPGWTYSNGSFSPPAVPPEPVQYARTYKADIWRRCTDEEAGALDAALTAAPVKLRRLWDDSQVLMHEAAEFGLIRDPMVTAFGEERADELLEASYWEFAESDAA